jgi:hypothetical protein
MYEIDPKWPERDEIVESVLDDIDELTLRQQVALTALLTNVTTEAAAEQSGISSRTMRRYMQDPAFAKAYRNGRRAMLEERVSALQQASQVALETLRTALDDEDANVRVRAARAIFDYAFKGLETERRIREVEELARDIEELKRELA